MRGVVRGALALGWVAGLAVACAASWYVWRHVPIASEDRLFAATLAPVVLWAVVGMFVGWWLRPREARATPPRLRDQRRTAIRFLADRGLAGRRRRHSLPLYLVLGQGGVGKTSLLERSETGLGMPATIGNSTWWVGRDAIFVETTVGAGESARDVFELVRAVRPQLPVNASLLVVSPADLTLADQYEHQQIARSLAEELRLLEDVTGAAAPVYLLLSKTDLVPGFREFFDRLEPQDRSAPWGFELPYHGLDAGPRPQERAGEIEAGFQRILGAMRVRHVEWLSREADPVRCARINVFAAQIAALRNAIRPILEGLFPEQTHAWRGVALRGVFLTSAHQEPLSIDALLPDLSRRFAMPRIGTLPPDLGLDEEEHGYFVAGAIGKAVLPEAGLVSTARRGGVARAAQWGAIALLVAASIGAAWVVFTAFDDEVRLAARVQEAAAAMPPLTEPSTIEGLPSVLAQMRRLDELAAQIDATPAPPDYAFGLTGRARYASALDQARRDLRVNWLLPHLAALIETQLVDGVADLDGLRGLIALAELADDPQSPALREWLEANALLVSDADRQLLVEQGLAGIDENGGLSIDPDYLEAARRIVAYRESLS